MARLLFVRINPGLHRAGITDRVIDAAAGYRPEDLVHLQEVVSPTSRIRPVRGSVLVGMGTSTATGPLTQLVLDDGTPAMIWPLLDTDAEALRSGYAELSPASRRFRFLTEVPELTDSLLRLLVDGVDGVHHVAVVLTAFPDAGGARPVGVGRLVRYPDEPEVADVAVTVLDAWQGRGVGRQLLSALLDRRPEGVVRLRTTVAAENRASLAMLSGAGRLTTRPDGAGALTVEVTGLPVPVAHG